MGQSDQPYGLLRVPDGTFTDCAESARSFLFAATMNGAASPSTASTNPVSAALYSLCVTTHQGASTAEDNAVDSSTGGHPGNVGGTEDTALSGGQIAGIFLGMVMVAAAIGGLWYWAHRRRRSRHQYVTTTSTAAASSL